MRTLIFCFCCLLSIACCAQKATFITYTDEIKFGAQSAGQLIGEVKKERVINTAEEAYALEQLTALFDTLQKQIANNTTQVWREGDWVVTREMNSAEGKVAKWYHINTLQFMSIDSFSSRRLNRVDTFQTSMNYRINPTWQVKYEVTKTKDRKQILQYKCRKYIIAEIKKIGDEEPEVRNITLWATRKIKPAISTHALLGLHRKMLQDYTPLHIEVRSQQMPELVHTIIAVQIK